MLLEVLEFAWMMQLCRSACLATWMFDSAEPCYLSLGFCAPWMSPVDESYGSM